MALMMSKLYAALRLAGVPDDSAIPASEEVAGFENRLARVESALNQLKWMIGFNLALSSAIIIKLFAPL